MPVQMFLKMQGQVLRQLSHADEPITPQLALSVTLSHPYQSLPRMSAVFGSYISFQKTILNSLCTFSSSSTPFFNLGSRTSCNGHALVANADEVVAELLDSVGGNTGLHDL